MAWNHAPYILPLIVLYELGHSFRLTLCPLIKTTEILGPVNVSRYHHVPTKVILAALVESRIELRGFGPVSARRWKLDVLDFHRVGGIAGLVNGNIPAREGCRCGSYCV